MIVENRTDTHCLDAAWFPEDNIILVDCYRIMTDKETKQDYLQNIFLYVNTTSHQPLELERFNDMYASYTRMTHRKIMAYWEDG